MGLPTTIVMSMRSGKLIPNAPLDLVKYEGFLHTLKEGDKVEMTCEVQSSDSSYAQLAKIHVCIRALAEESGDSFEGMKLVIKEKSGLINGDNIKSFADCSKQELSEVIKTCLSVGQLLQVNLI